MDPSDINQFIHSKDDKGNTPIDIACYLGYKNLTLYLLRYGADPSQYDNRKRNAFHYVCEKGEYYVCNVLLNFMRHQRREEIFTSLTNLKKTLGFKCLDVKEGELVSTVWHDE